MRAGTSNAAGHELSACLSQRWDAPMAEIKIKSREELIYLLSEAAEIEHGVACSYLFAAFTMKNDASEGLSEDQLAAVQRWRRVLLQVAGQEMTHLTLASNMLTAIGAAPQLRRPNFPAGSGYYPDGFALVATPFDEETLQHFLFIERPEGMEMDDGSIYRAPGQPHPDPVASSDVTAEPRAFATIGELYHAIEDGFRHLSERLRPDTLFIGPPRAQATSDYFSFDELLAVVDLATAIEAIETIVEEGEGARGDIENSHYGRFLAVQEEYEQILAADADFKPSRPVLANPFTRVPSDSPDVNLIDDPFSVEVCDLFDDCYEVLLQMLAHFFAHTEETTTELKALADATGSSKPLSVASPADVNSNVLPAHSSRTTLETSTCPGSARSVMRAASWTAVPKRSSSSAIGSPALMPMRTRTSPPSSSR